MAQFQQTAQAVRQAGTEKYIHKRYNQIILDIQIANIELGTDSNR
jgi:hypothetical protein